MKQSQKRNFVIVFLLPPLLIYIIFFVFPFINAFRVSFYKWSGLSTDMTFIGFSNFRKMLSDPLVSNSVSNTLFLIFFTSLFTFILSMFFAVVFTSKSYPEIPFYRVLFFFPHILSIIIVSLLWKFIYNPNFGLLNGILNFIGIEANYALLASSRTVLPALVAPQTWMLVGFYMVLFIASINTVPTSLYEAARIDGAGTFRQFISITIPNIWYTMQISFVFFIITTVNNSFPLVSVTTGGGPSNSSEVVTTYFYDQAFRLSNFGYGSAIGMTIFVIMFIFALLIMRFTRRSY